MQTLLSHLGRSSAAAFMAFALAALTTGAVSVAAIPSSPAAVSAAAFQA